VPDSYERPVPMVWSWPWSSVAWWDSSRGRNTTHQTSLPERSGRPSNGQAVAWTSPAASLPPEGKPSRSKISCAAVEGGGKRREWDSNPRALWAKAFQEPRIRPLCHPSRQVPGYRSGVADL
jgi:hypothetical protein